MLLEAEATHFPLAKRDRHLPGRVFSVRPPLSETLEAHTVYPSGLLLLFLFAGLNVTARVNEIVSPNVNTD